MNINRRNFLAAAGVTTLGAAIPGLLGQSKAASLAPAPAASPLPAAAKAADRPPLLDKALAALDAQGSRITQRDLIGLVDFSAHSSEPRFQLVDVASGEIAATYLVAHGRGSDPGHSGYLESFSNVHGSNASSRGSYRIANIYYGKYGRSRRLIGLDPDNDQALDRAIVMHGADYVSPGLIDTQGRIGRSFGCFSLAQDKIGEALDRLSEGCLLYADKA